MENILKEVCKELDHDIGETLFADSDALSYRKDDPMQTPVMYKNWELLKDPVHTALGWQGLREMMAHNGRRP